MERARVAKETAGEITPADPGPGVPPSRAVGGKHLLFKPPGSPDVPPPHLISDCYNPMGHREDHRKRSGRSPGSCQDIWLSDHEQLAY